MDRKVLLPIYNYKLIATFEYEDFIIEVTYDYEKETNEIWLRHKASVVKSVFGVIKGIELCDCECCIDYMTNAIREYIDDAIELYMDCFGEEEFDCCDECQYDDCEHCTLEE